MIKALVFDFSRVLLFPRDSKYVGSLNEKHRELSSTNNYNFLKHFALNEELLDYLARIKTRYGLYVFTSETIQDSPEMKPRLQTIFKDVFSGLKLGINKKDPSAYRKLANLVGEKPEEILFIDDSPDNLKAAKSSGFQVIHYTDNIKLVEDLETKLAK